MQCRATKDGKLISFGKIYITNPEVIKVNDVSYSKVNNFLYKKDNIELFFSLATRPFTERNGTIVTIINARYLKVSTLTEDYYYMATGNDLSHFVGEEGYPLGAEITISTPMNFVFETLDNYAKDVDAVVESLRQRLSVIKGELWYQINYGIPLFEKRTKSFMDAAILGIINGHPAVANILDFSSTVNKQAYSFSCRIMTIYNEELTLDNKYAI